MEGPAYFVSNGGEGFPNLIVVLQGARTIDLVGDTFISKAGVTSSTFKTVPDQPVESFELNLPAGPYSALTTDGDPCTQKLTMPTESVARERRDAPPEHEDHGHRLPEEEGEEGPEEEGRARPAPDEGEGRAEEDES